MVHLNDLVLSGWDISSLSMDKAMDHAHVLDYDLQCQVAPYLTLLGRPLPSIYYPDFIMANQEARADSLIAGMDTSSSQSHLGRYVVVQRREWFGSCSCVLDC